MNTKNFQKKTREFERLSKIDKKEIKKPVKVGKTRKSGSVFLGFILALIVAVIFFFMYRNYIYAIISFISALIIFSIYKFFRARLKESTKIKKMESVFPDFLQLMSSNLRAGMTIDKAMLLSSRPEFFPLDGEIQKAGRDIATGKDIELSLLEMSRRIGSEKIHKTILLIISGIKAGGNLAVLLEETAVNLRERDFVEKRAASNVMMYAIFIFVAVAIGAPALFSLSSVLVEILSNLLGNLPTVQAASLSVPFTLSKINISIEFIKYFSLVFIIFIDILTSLVLGLVLKGEEKEGLKYIIPLLIISIVIFFAIRILLGTFMEGLF